MAYITETQRVNSIIDKNAPMTLPDVIKDLIESQSNKKEKERINDGTRYFAGEHDIKKKDFSEFWVSGQREEDRNASNIRNVHNFHRLTVEQKTGYIVGNPIKITTDDDQKNAKVLDAIKILINEEKFDDCMNDWVEGASNKGQEWLHVYLSRENAEFKYTIVGAEQIIPIFDTEHLEELKAVLRYYKIEIIEGTKSEPQERIRAEWWDRQQVTYYLSDSKGNFHLDDTVQENPQPHWSVVSVVDDQAVDVDVKSWGRVPFIRLANNTQLQSDLELYRDIQDDINLTDSIYANDLADFAEVIRILKGYDGTDLGEFMRNLKVFKAIKVSERGSVDTDRSEIPIEAKDSHLDRLERNLFTIGMAVFPKDQQFGTAPSGVALQFMYHFLDLKADNLIRKMKPALHSFFWFVVEYLKQKDSSMKDFDAALLKFEFNKSRIMNDKETIETLSRSQTFTSLETIREKNPLVDDTNTERERWDKQQEATRISFEDDINEGGDE